MAARRKSTAIVPQAEAGGPLVTALGGGLEGAERTSRETMTWVADRRSPDQLINMVKAEADARGRDVVTNDGYAQGVIDINRDNIVGTQYRLNAQPNFAVLSRLISKSFDETWATEYQEYIEEKFNLIAESNQCLLDASGQFTFTGLIRLGIAGFVYTGEVLATSEWIRDGRPFNTAIQMVSPMRLSNPDNRMDDALLRRGIAINQYGRPMGYYIRMAYPTEFYNNANSYTWAYVPAVKPWGRKMVIHIKDPFEAGQTRGISALVAVLKDMRMTKKFSDVTLQNAVVNASYAATIESELPPDVIAAAMGASATGDANGAYLGLMKAILEAMKGYASNANSIAVDGAKIPHLFPGTKLNAKTLGTPGGIGTEFEVSLLRHIAAGLGISYEEFARDFSRTNYSSARASMLTTWKHMMARKKFVADKQADEIFALWLEEEMNSAGVMPLPLGIKPNVFYTNGALGIGFEALRSAEWIGAGRGQIDELKETQAAILRVSAGLSTREYEIAKQGGDWRKVFRQLAREQTVADQYEITFDTTVTKPTGGAQTGDTGGAADDNNDANDAAESGQQNSSNQNDGFEKWAKGFIQGLV